MAKAQSIIGQTFGQLLVVAEAPNTSSYVRRSVCQCSCGVSLIVFNSNLRTSHTRSCGHLKHAPRRRSHGLSSSPEYKIWNAMHARCTNPRSHSYPRYGGRGIYYVERWRKFVHFISDMGPRPSPKHMLERRDNDGPYSPENCYWATAHEQYRNRRSNVWLTFNGQTLVVADWATLTGFSHHVIVWRYRRGWSIEDVLTRPVRQR